MMVQRAKNNVTEEMYQLYEDATEAKIQNVDLNNIKIIIQDYPTAPKLEYLCTLVQAVENGEYSLFTTLSFMFEVKEVTEIEPLEVGE